MKYLVSDELKQISSLVNFLEKLPGDLYFDITVTDSNGDELGKVGITDAAEYGFIIEE